ncbi:DegT/DnrJ/EryC1/StrS aminotransferase family protein [Variovorax paradoxus]|uniref:dTDP-4-amino-4,6-dideoxygalactose transaminase n=1 Tax=Variovorax paradoxus TaxID=34073 RepID=A0AAW8ECD6_VARPD|nr:DegT/DnrJ/EryC1/StrS aminotransferase family protein [Variovorax paradoxus]MDP9970608.1 dTDP-4-amino-4,6-dideoxygalactose transaminase [Variovorax paradoxus]
MPPELPFLPFALPDTGEEEIAEVSEAIRSGWITTGPKAKRFERDFGMFLGDTQLHCMAVNSATAGLHLALEALGVGPGDEVITTTHTFTATAEVVRYLGADVVLVDVDCHTLCIDVRQLEAAITTRTKAVIPVHYAGLSADMTTLMAIARKHGLKVVEDAAHALPTTSDGRLVGTLDSDITVFSFYANKTISTGEGGMVVTRNTSLAERIKVMRLHGINRDAFDRFRSTKPAWYYEVIAPGFKYNMTDIAAGMGIAQLAKLPRFIARRQYLAERYGERLASLPLLLPALPPTGEIHAWHLYVIRLTEDATISRDALIQALSDKGIGTSVHYIPLHRQPYWRDRYGLNAQMFPHSEAAYQRMLSIPLFTAMADSDQDRVISALQELLS